MGDNIFEDDSHISTWVFFPPAWGGELEACWTEGFSMEQLIRIFNHLKSCLSCRQKEIEATLRWAVLRPRASYMEKIPIKTAETNGECVQVTCDLAPPLVERIRRHLILIESEIQELKKIVDPSNKPKGPHV
jgi:hypothetical protein